MPPRLMPPPPKPPPPKPRASADWEARVATARVAAAANVRIDLRDMVVLQGFEFPMPVGPGRRRKVQTVFCAQRRGDFPALLILCRAEAPKPPQNAGCGPSACSIGAKKVDLPRPTGSRPSRVNFSSFA